MLFLLNGGSILAALTFIGSLYGRADAALISVAKALAVSVTGALIWFAGGLFATGFWRARCLQFLA